MRVRVVLLVVLMVGLVAPSLPAQVASADLSKEISKFFAQYFEERLRDEPEFATTVGRHEYDDRWADVSRQGREQRRSHLVQREIPRGNPGRSRAPDGACGQDQGRAIHPGGSVASAARRATRRGGGVAIHRGEVGAVETVGLFPCGPAVASRHTAAGGPVLLL